MKQILEQYGTALIGLTVAMFVLTAIMGGGAFGQGSVVKKIGELLNTGLAQKSIFVETDGAFDDYKKVGLPDIEVTDASVFVAGRWIRVMQAFQALDENGTAIALSVVGGWKDSNESIKVQGLGTSQVLFPEAGIYWVEVEARDAKGHQRNILTKVCVNGG